MTKATRTLYCCGCGCEATARKVSGADIYPNRPDLSGKVFWRCDACRNYVGTHKSEAPLGCIPTPELRKARGHIHAILDPIWKQRRMDRGQLYKRLTETLGRQYHTADLRTIDECRMIYRAVQAIDRETRSST
jgi:hypothetical protein